MCGKAGCIVSNSGNLELRLCRTKKQGRGDSGKDCDFGLMTRYLFTTQASDDLGLLTRTLPVAHALAERGHQVAFCNFAPAPRKLIAEAGFENLPQKHPVHYLNHLQASGESGWRKLGHIRQEFGGILGFVRM
jgi:hypothetical protein